MRKYGLRLTVLILAVAISLSVALGDCYVTVLHFNDSHGHLQPNRDDEGGMARIATLADEVRDCFSMQATSCRARRFRRCTWVNPTSSAST